MSIQRYRCPKCNAEGSFTEVVETNPSPDESPWFAQCAKCGYIPFGQVSSEESRMLRDADKVYNYVTPCAIELTELMKHLAYKEGVWSTVTESAILDKTRLLLMKVVQEWDKKKEKE